MSCGAVKASSGHLLLVPLWRSHFAVKMASQTQCELKVSVVGSVTESNEKAARVASGLGHAMYVESAGGVNSPALRNNITCFLPPPPPILSFRDEYYRNYIHLTQYFAEPETYFAALDPSQAPPRLDSAKNVPNTSRSRTRHPQR
ncbi:uncharacterized protein EDB93DRAFT_480955 [Suillus bovinus]|uniref:uncharacterized protein n=1 Tax=Suillus bovinus TaxID=48563 RepID=UPI001B8850AF|nr:uncharacterized protein EDB93DRAFT_480955 [Suillus bovinus]KAG2146066.1 hypothetical protein EDB93DRAFT_480955 [Suillus bovinus]